MLEMLFMTTRLLFEFRYFKKDKKIQREQLNELPKNWNGWMALVPKQGIDLHVNM